MKKTLLKQYSFLNIFKSLIIISVVIYTIFFLISIEGQLEIISQTDNPLILIISVLTYILFLVSSVGGIMIINFLFKLDKTKKNNLEGEKTNYYGSGEKLSEGTYKDGELDGLFTEWYENGQKKKEGTYKDGKKDGLWTDWYENGQKEVDSFYKNGIPDSIWTFYKDDKTDKIITILDGKKIKESKFFLSSEQIEYEVGFNSDGKLDGSYTHWNNNGQVIKSGFFKNGERDSLWIFFKGQIGDIVNKIDSSGTYKSDKKEGRWYFQTKNKRNDEVYKNGILQSEWTFYTEVGSGKYDVTYRGWNHPIGSFTDSLGNKYTGDLILGSISSEQTVIFGRELKPFFCYDFSKYPFSIGTLKNYKEIGNYIYWYEKGQKSKEGKYLDGNEIGKWTYWSPNGKETSELICDEINKCNGEKTWWYKNGQKKRIESYKDGELLYTKCWNIKGNNCDECGETIWSQQCE